MAFSLLGLIRAIFINNAGLLADGYDLAVIDLIIAILGELHPDAVTPQKKGIMASLMFAGMLTGMPLFGLLADLFSHKTAALATSALSTLGCALAACCMKSESFYLTYQLALCRFLLGLGVGGEYPVSMTLGNDKKTSNQFREAGVPLTPLQILGISQLLINLGGIIAPGLGSVLLESGLPLHVIWRVLCVCGMVPSACVFIARTQMPSQSAEQSSEEMAPRDDSVTWASTLGLVRSIGWHWPVLLGCCLTWSCHNFAFFGQGSFRSVMEEGMFGSSGNSRVQLAHDAHFGLFLSLAAALGGGATLIVGLNTSFFKMQLINFTGGVLFGGVCSLLVGLDSATNWEVFLSFNLQTFFLSGAGVCCYIIPTQFFPARVHGTCCGIAAAAGKTGALLGTALFPILEHAYGMSILLLVCSCVGSAALIVTVMLVPRHLPDPSELVECKLSARC